MVLAIEVDKNHDKNHDYINAFCALIVHLRRSRREMCRREPMGRSVTGHVSHRNRNAAKYVLLSQVDAPQTN